MGIERELPTGWTAQTVGECMSAIIDYRGKTPQKVAFGVPLITAKIVKGGRILPPEEFIAEIDYEVWMRRGMPKPGDVVVTTEAPLGEVAQLDERKIALAQRLIGLRGKPDRLDNTFLRFAMQSTIVQDQLTARSSGTTVHGIRQAELRHVEIPLPPLPEQRAIAHVLRGLDDKIELNRRMNRTLEDLGRGLFRSWFVDFDPATKNGGAKANAAPAGLIPKRLIDSSIGPIPEGWRVSTIGDEVTVVGGSTPSTAESRFWEGGTHCWVTPRDLSRLSDPVVIDTERLITDAGLSQISSGLLPRGTVLMSSRAPIGYLCIADVPVAVNQGFIAMKCEKSLPGVFVLPWCQENMDEVFSRAGGTTFAEISKAAFRPIPVLVPPAPVVSAFARAAQPWHDQIVANVRASRTLAALRDALLPQLLSGEIRLSEAGKSVEEVLA